MYMPQRSPVAMHPGRRLRVGSVGRLDAEQALDAADDTADRAADDGPDRSRGLATLIDTMRDAAGNTLRLRRERRSERRDDDGRE